MISRIPTMKTFKGMLRFIISIQPFRLTWDNDYIFLLHL